MPVGVNADQGLQDGGGDLKCEGDQTDLPEVEVIRALEQRIHRRNHGLQDVVEEMRQANRG